MKPVVILFAVTACSTSSPSPKQSAAGGLALGDATVYELVDRRFTKLDTPRPELRLHGDGTLELIHDKTGEVWRRVTVKPDGRILDGDNSSISIGEHAITYGPEMRYRPVTIDGDTVTVRIDTNVTLKVALGAGGDVTVLDSPYGVKWHIAASDPAVARTAFLVLAALDMEAALD